MGCCGEPYDKPATNGQKQVGNNGYPIVQQPTPHPGAQFQEKQFQQPSIPSPPPTHQFGQNGFPQQSWTPVSTQSPSPHPNQPYNPYGMSGTTSPGPIAPQFSGTTLNGMHPNGSFPAPTPGHLLSPSLSAPVMTTSRVTQNPVPQVSDEGKMSVSIDFGTTFSGVVSLAVCFSHRCMR